MTVRLTLHPGQTPDMVAACAEAIAHAWRMHAVRVSSPERGRVLLTCLAIDPLASVERDDPAADKTDAADPDALMRVKLGRLEDGASWELDFRVVPHHLVVGATQSGKSTWMASLVCGLAPRPVALVGIDLKGGMELSLFEPRLSGMATDRPGAVRLLGALVDVALERMATCRVHGARSVWDLPDHVRPVPVVVLVDEVAEIFLAASRDEKKEAEAAVMSLVRLAQLGRAVGVFLVVAGQRVGADLGPGATALRAQLGGRVCHRVSDPGTAAMALGDLHPEAVDAALSITPERAGVAVTVVDGGWVLARAAYVSAGDAAVIAAGHADMTPSMPELIAALMPPSEGGKRGG
ncbi:cell division protein FtsK [Yinghuangia sp. ASG 101]|uniref:FtsK/SpoIIIE domain-containing protein n=1 Tax=Yinghuangia sp. ASG 101 TaxID=2896848 RepID=UPI001E318470|nr:FtsK/SpoIIIE domain-containing protein [Yinghuangia sp. ASG 101]UGQ09361.1 cell division protein FtsK [Yinghuangia sp. ASG 101]